MVIDGNLRVNGDTTVIYAENTAIKDALIELGQNNTSEDTTLDLGVLMHRPEALSNVVIGYREESDEFAIGYTDANPTDKTFTPKSDEDINVHVYGLTHVDANIYAHEDLTLSGNAYVSGNVVASQDLLVTGNVYVSTNVDVTQELTVSGNVYADKDLEVVGNVYVDGNVVAYQDLLVTGNVYAYTNVEIAQELTITGNAYADRDLEVAGNVYVDGNVVAYQDILVTGNVYVSTNVSVSKELTVTGNVYADKDLEVVGNTHVSGNVEVTKDLIVTGNTHLEGPNVFITHTMDFLDPTTAIVTDLNSNVEVKLNQLANVVIGTKALANEDMLVYDGSNWTNQLQNHTFLYAKAEEAISKGDAVYATGAIGNNTFSIRKAQANSSTTMPALGLAYQAFTLNQQGLIVTFGRSDGINTDNFITGETVYVSNVTAGALSNVKPYGATDLIQNIGLVVKGHQSTGIVSVTGVGRSNDIPNAVIETSNASVNYVYVNSVNNDLRKIDPMKLPTKLQTLSQVVNTGNAVANAVTLRGVSITSGDGFHGDLVVAGNVTVDTNTLKVDAEANRVGILTASPGQTLDVRGAANVGTFTTTTGTVTDGTHSTSKDTGVLVLTHGGLGVEANIHSTNVFATSHIAVGTSATSNTFDVRGTANVGALVTTSTHISDSTAVTSKTTGALQVTGGVGIQGDIHATHANLEDVEADSVTVTDATEATSTTTGALKVTGGVGIQKDLYARDGHFSTDVSVGSLTGSYLPYADNGNKILKDSLISMEENGVIKIAANVEIVGNIIVTGNTFNITANDITITDRIIDIANNNPSHELDIGILMEHPGYNIGIIHHGTHPHHLSFGYTGEGPGTDHVDWKSDSHITANVWGHLITQNTVTVEYNDVYIVGGGLGIGIGDRGDGTPDANIHVVGNVFVTSNISTASNVLITGDAAATSKTTGALQVAGGVGVQGDIYGVTVYTDDYLTHIDDTNTKIGFPANDTFTVTTNNAERIRVNSSGSVGINTDSPAYNLDVRGTSNVGVFTTPDASVTDATPSSSTTTGALTVAGGISTQTNVHAANVYISGGLITNTAGVTRKTYAYSGTIGDTEQPQINVCFTNQSFSAKIDAQLIEGDDEISTISLFCCGGNKSGTLSASDIQTGSIQVFGPASTNPWSSVVVADKTTVALKPSAAIDTSGEYHIFVEYTTAKAGGAVANIVQDTTEQIVFGY
jgi:cytoskeletal protein CcmA (bactofilin family)